MFKRFVCRAVRRSLPDYVTNRLSSDQCDRIERHLATCRDCGSRHHSMRRAAEFAGTVRRDAFPASLTSWEDLRSQIETAPQPAFLSQRRPSAFMLAGATAAICAAGVIFRTVRPRHVLAGAPLVAASPSHGDTNSSVLPRVVLRRSDAAPTGEGTGATKHFQPALVVHSKPAQATLPGLWTPHAEAPLSRAVAKPGTQAMPVRTDDIAYINADVTASLKRWTARPATDLRQMDVALQQRVAGGDKFVTVPLPLIAGQGAAAVKSAVAEQQREAAIVDTRLVRKVSVQAKRISFFDLCERLRREAGVRVTANRCVADDKITLYCHPRPLRDLMRQISRHFGFTWVRKGEEGSYEYELTQTLRSKLLEEGIRERDEEEMLLAIDRAMEPYRRFTGMSFAQLKALPADVARAELQPLSQLQNGGLAAMNLYFALSRHELDMLRTGQPLKLDLNSNDAALLSAGVTDGIRGSFGEFYERERRLAEQNGEHGPINNPANFLSATLQLDRSKPGEFALKGELSDGQTGLTSNLAVAKSPAYEVHNARDNAALAHDATLQRPITLKLAATATLLKTRYPDTEGLNESAGGKVTTADVMEAIYQATGMDVISDYYSHLYDPASVTVSDLRLYDALNRIGDRMCMRWTKGDGWLQFRTGTFYYDRPQEIPNRLLERWQSARARQGVLTPEDLTEIAQLPDAQLDSLWMAQGAEASYGLREWQMGRNAQLRPHWRFLARLSEEQRREVCSEQGLSYERMTPEQKIHFLEMAYDGDENRPGYNQIAVGNLRLLYAFGRHPISEGASYAIMPSNPLLFIYSCNPPGERKHLAVVGPFNGTYGMLEEHLTPQSLEIVPGRDD